MKAVCQGLRGAGRRSAPYLFGGFLLFWVVMEVLGHAGLVGL